MGVEKNLQLIDQWVEAYNVRDFDRFAELFAENALYRAPGPSYPLTGREVIRDHIATAPGKYPDARFEKVRSFGNGDLVCIELTWTGTNKGPIPGQGGEVIAATGKSVEFPCIYIFQLDEGEIVEAVQYFDRLHFLTQLGLHP